MTRPFIGFDDRLCSEKWAGIVIQRWITIMLIRVSRIFSVAFFQREAGMSTLKIYTLYIGKKLKPATGHANGISAWW